MSIVWLLTNVMYLDRSIWPDMESWMTEKSVLTPATELAELTEMRFPNESESYRLARKQLLLAEEIELRRHIDRVAQMRRSLPAGDAVTQSYEFERQNGSTTFSKLFGNKDTLIVYSMMFGPQRKRPCSICTALLTSWDGTARNLRERVLL
jgi:predicted dithiol-disulfide oxidoreductase (DUF899 family)